MRKIIIFLVALSLVLGNVFMPMEATAQDMIYVPPASVITDIDNHWANESITALVNLEILSGYPDKTFKPNNSITRAEYLTSLFKTVCVLDDSILSEDIPDSMGYFNYFGYRANERSEFLQKFSTIAFETPYTDLENHWSKNYVAWVKNYCEKKNPGLFERIFPGTNFYPNQPITREEAVLVTLAFTTSPVQSRGMTFKDISPDYEFYTEIVSLVDNGIINGYPDGTFKPKEKITRAAAAVIMTNVLKEIAYNQDFFADSDTYTFSISSSNDGDYLATFMTEEMYQNPPTELDKIYAADFKAYELERQMLQELMEVEIYNDLEALGYEFGTDEYYEKIQELSKAIEERYEKIKIEEIPYYQPERDRLEILKELEQKDYWNKAGLYYWMYKYDPNNSLEYLEKAEINYQIDKNGNDDLYKIYEEFINYYVQEKKNKKALEYIEKANRLFQPDEYGYASVANMEDVRFYPFAARCLASLGEYEKALDYLEKLFAKGDVPFETYFALERGSLMYLCGQKDKAVYYLKEGLNNVESEEYVNESLRDKYIWALKYIERQDVK